MSMKVVRTLLGDIAPEEIGVTDCHDHLIRSGGPEIKIDPAFLMDDEEEAKQEFRSFLQAGGRTMVCMDPIGCGRNVPKMLRIAQSFRGQGNLMMTTGFQKGSLYDSNTSFLATVEKKKVTQMMVAEIEEGMDRHSYNGPVVERVPARAGIIKAGTSYRVITKLEHKALVVAAWTQKETGCPISVHTDFGTMGPELLDVIEQSGGNVEHTIICHVQRNPDRYYYKMLLDRGVYLCFEESNKPQYRPDTEIAETIRWIVDQGYGSQVLLGMDGGRKEALAAYMAPTGQANGLDYMLRRFVPVLRWAGVAKKDIFRILEENPRYALSIWR